MPRRRSKKESRPLKELDQRANILQNRRNNHVSSKLEGTPAQSTGETIVEPLINIKSILEDENCQPIAGPSSNADDLATAALYSELDSFRQRWKRELEVNKESESVETQDDKEGISQVLHKEKRTSLETPREKPLDVVVTERETLESKTSSSCSGDQIYAEAKKLFLTAVELEKDEMYHESIRYYKQSMHLCPDIEKQIYREQCEASAKSSGVVANSQGLDTDNSKSTVADCETTIDLHGLILENFSKDSSNTGYKQCKPSHRHKSGALHISDLPHELLLQIVRYVIGDDLSLGSLESLGMVCRGFYLLTRYPDIWRDICYTTWSKDNILKTICDTNQRIKTDTDCTPIVQIDWRQMYLDRPRVNYDGIYISKTRYIRQGDVGYQDITYRPFHVIRYYRYIRFFPDKRVLILTTNEEPEIVVPIFRHTLKAKQFTAEFSALEGTYEYSSANHITICAEKTFRQKLPSSFMNNRVRQAQPYLYRQTPSSQRFDFQFEIKTAESKPYKNNVLKWITYTMLTRFETEQEVTSFDVSPDTFPNLIFSRVKRLNMKLKNPLSIC